MDAEMPRSPLQAAVPLALPIQLLPPPRASHSAPNTEVQAGAARRACTPNTALSCRSETPVPTAQAHMDSIPGGPGPSSDVRARLLLPPPSRRRWPLDAANWEQSSLRAPYYQLFLFCTSWLPRLHFLNLTCSGHSSINELQMTLLASQSNNSQLKRVIAASGDMSSLASGSGLCRLDFTEISEIFGPPFEPRGACGGGGSETVTGGQVMRDHLENLAA